MARSWKQERTTPKTTPVKPARPRMSDFAKELYQGKGYLVDPYCDEPEPAPCAEPGCTGFKCESCWS